MNDTDSRLNEALLPISHNANTQPPGNASRAQPFSSRFTQSSSSVSAESHGRWGKAKKYCWWTTVILTVLIIFLVISLKLFVFKPISKKSPTLDNSTAIEPNTKTRFRLLMDGPHSRVQSLVGASVWAYSIPVPTHPKIQVAAVGFYVERAEGKRRLKRFRNKDIDNEMFEDVVDVLAKTGMTETLRFVMATTPPEGRMLQWWWDYADPILQRDCPTLADAEWKVFSEFFPDPFEKNDDFSFERRDGQEIYGYRKDEDRLKAKRIGGPCLGRALFEAQLIQQKKGLINLLDDFFER
jgi:hypothetical protein